MSASSSASGGESLEAAIMRALREKSGKACDVALIGEIMGRRQEITELADSNEGEARSEVEDFLKNCLLYTSPSPRDGLLSRMPSSA